MMGCLLPCPWLRLLFTDTFLKFPCEGGRLKHIPPTACEHGRACLPTAVWWPPIAAWEGNYRELKVTARENPKSLNAFWFSFWMDVWTCLGVFGSLLLKHQTSSLIQLKHWWDGFLLWLWLRLLFTETCLEFPSRRQIEEHALKCLRARDSSLTMQGPPIAAAWERNYPELNNTCTGEPQELELKVIFSPKQLRNRCLQWAGCVAQVAVHGSNQTDFFVAVVHFSGYDSADGA